MSLLRGAVAGAVCAGMHVAYRYEDHWWYDNVAHFLGGYAVGTALCQHGSCRTLVLREFLAVATGWECFEYLIGERPWDGSMCWDHACEDTVLDTICGLVGVWVACEHQRLE